MKDDPDIQIKTSKWSKSQDQEVKNQLVIEPCKIKSICNTCKYINGSYELSLEDKHKKGIDLLTANGLTSHAQILPPNPSPQKLNYRTHAKLAVRPNIEDEGRRFAIGLFKRGTHEIIDLVNCPLHRKTMNALIEDLKELLEASGLSPYDDVTDSGDLRYFTIRASHTTDALMVTFVVTRKCKAELVQLVQNLKQRKHKITVAYMNLHTERNNAIFSDESTLLSGAKRLRETICELSFEISPTSFFQVNPWTAESIYRRVAQLAGQAHSAPIAWDLYCGIGQISMVLARAGYRTLGIEQNPQATRDAHNNAVNNELQNHLHFLAGRVEDLQGSIPSWAWPPELVVANPSRKGISEQMLHFIVRALKKAEAPRFIYVSCEVETLARDLVILKEAGYHLRQIESFDMFPFTDKMEWLTVITK